MVFWVRNTRTQNTFVFQTQVFGTQCVRNTEHSRVRNPCVPNTLCSGHIGSEHKIYVFGTQNTVFGTQKTHEVFGTHLCSEHKCSEHKVFGTQLCSVFQTYVFRTQCVPNTLCSVRNIFVLFRSLPEGKQP